MDKRAIEKRLERLEEAAEKRRRGEAVDLTEVFQRVYGSAGGAVAPRLVVRWDAEVWRLLRVAYGEDGV